MVKITKTMLAAVTLAVGTHVKADDNPYGTLDAQTLVEMGRLIKECDDYYKPKIAAAKAVNDRATMNRCVALRGSYLANVRKITSEKAREIEAAAKAKAPVPAPAVFPKFVPQDIAVQEDASKTEETAEQPNADKAVDTTQPTAAEGKETANPPATNKENQPAVDKPSPAAEQKQPAVEKKNDKAPAEQPAP